jgi:tetratricopeptide (TPR) repeat protein
VTPFEAALALHQSGDLDAAQAAYHAILAAEPGHADTIGLLGVLAHQRGRPDAALDLIDRALGLRPDLSHLHAHRCVALCALGRLDEALATIVTAESQGLDPQHCLVTRANILCDLRRYAEGAALYEQALAANPDLIPARMNLGMARWRHGDLAQAEAVFQAALQDHPELVDAHYGLGLVHRARNDLVAANLAQRNAVAINPDHAPAQLELGEMDLLAGYFESGFAGYEWRHHLPHAAGLLPRFDVPAWDGAPLEGAGLFVYVEQGYGDCIQFARFLPQAAALGARIVLGVSAPLARLFQGLAGVERLVTDWNQAAPYQFHAPISSLARLLGVNGPQAIPTAPYLTADPIATARFGALIGAGDGPAVGLVWTGRPDNPNDARRSIDPALLEPLTRCGARLFALQKDLAPPPNLGCVDLGSLLTDFAEVAAAISALDLVITVDTAAAHLAGALGKPVWILLPFAPDWRWRLDRADSDWYPSARLFRQEAPGDWAGVIATVADQLGRLTQRA